jgi:hypothetical protein
MRDFMRPSLVVVPQTRPDASPTRDDAPVKLGIDITQSAAAAKGNKATNRAGHGDGSGQARLAHRVQQEEDADGQEHVTGTEDVGQGPGARRGENIAQKGHVRVQQRRRVEEAARGENAPGSPHCDW